MFQTAIGDEYNRMALLQTFDHLATADELDHKSVQTMQDAQLLYFSH